MTQRKGKGWGGGERVFSLISGIPTNVGLVGKYFGVLLKRSEKAMDLTLRGMMVTTLLRLALHRGGSFCLKVGRVWSRLR